MKCRRLESDPGLGDVTHILVDEVHERSEDSDFLLMILRDTLKKRPDLHVILMSATVNADLFSSYFSGCPVLEIPGRTFPVQQIFLEECLHQTRYSLEETSPYARRQERQNHGGLDKNVFKGDSRDYNMDEMSAEFIMDNANFKPAKFREPDEKCSSKQVFHRYKVEEGWSEPVARTLALMDFEKINYELIEQTVVYIAEGGSSSQPLAREGSILIFLPGMAEIQTLHEQLSSNRRLQSKDFKLIPLHSSLSSEEQSEVFSKPRYGQRKIVISTNIAETSITIEDCVYVIEAGKMKERRFDPDKNMRASTLSGFHRRTQSRERVGQAESDQAFVSTCTPSSGSKTISGWIRCRKSSGFPSSKWF